MENNQPAKDFFALGVDEETFAKALTGQEMQIQLPLDDDDYTEILENYQGGLMLNCDAPDTYHGVYYWNHGAFPYLFKRDLKRVIFVYEGRVVPMCIKGIEPTVGRRFRFDHKAKRSVADPEGDSCIWNLTFTLRKCADEEALANPRTFLLRWNPGISSFKLQDYKDLVSRYPDGFNLNWSIYQWEEVREGDRFYMMRVGDEHAGLMFRGWFISEPYAGDDWAGKGKPRHYADMDCVECSSPDAPRVTLAELTAALPGVEWGRGHSGVLLTDEQAAKFDSLWESHQ